MAEKVLHRNIDLTTTQTQILRDNFLRKYVLFVNDSDAIAYLSLGVPAAANQGIRVNASGGSFELDSTNMFAGRIYAISMGVTKRLMVTETSYGA